MDLSGAPQWTRLDPADDDADGTQGLVTLLVAASGQRSSKVRVAGFLLDVWCLGVKNAMPVDTMTEGRLAEYRALYFGSYRGCVPIPAELARALVTGAAEYARGLGFAPHEDFASAVDVLGTTAGPSPIRFGREGKPCYVSGPYDDSGAVVRKLRRNPLKQGFSRFSGGQFMIDI